MPEAYRYPFENEDDYKARVIFSLVKSEPTGETSGQSFSTEINNLKDKRNALLSQLDEIKANLDTEDKSEADYKREIADIERQLREIAEQIREYEGLESQSQVASNIEVSDTSVSLYLPAGLAFRDNVTYENFDLGVTGAGMEAGLGFAESMTKGIGSFISGITGSGGADVAKLAGIQLAGKFGNFAAEAQAAQKIAGGVTLNPNSRVLFKQPNIREFAFAFKFVARSQREAQEVNNIIKFLRTELYPDEINSSETGDGIALGYRFPNKFRIAIEYDGNPIPGLAKIQNCYLRDVSTTYNASQMAMHSDGQFMEVDMTLNFQETRALTRAKIEEGF